MAPSDKVLIGDLPPKTDQAAVSTIFGAYGSIASVRMIPGKNAAIVQFQTEEEAKWIVENLDGNIAQDLTTPVTCKFATLQQEQPKAPMGGKGGAIRPGPYDGANRPGGSVAGGACFNGGKGWQGGAQQPCFGGGGTQGAAGTGDTIQILKKGLQSAGVLPGGRWSNDENALYLNGLPSDTTDLDLYEIFSPFGAIASQGVKAMTNDDGTCKGFGFLNFLDQGATTNAMNTLNGTIMPDGSTLRVMKARSKPRMAMVAQVAQKPAGPAAC